MADIDDINAAQTVKVVGASSDGTEQVPIGSTTDGRLKIEDLPNKISTLNSTSTPLVGSGVFTGDWEDCSLYSTITISVLTSHASALNGLQFQTSSNGTDWDNGDTFTMPAMVDGEAKVYSFGVTSKFYRVIYTNGATTQTSFRLQVILHSRATKNSSHRISDNVMDDDDGELIKSIITGKSPSGIYKNVATDENGNLAIALAQGANVIPTLGTGLVYDDMNAITGDVARGTIVTNDVWHKVYQYDATSGLLFGIRVTLENLVAAGKSWWVRLVVDDIEVFGSNGFDLVDVGTITLYGWESDATKLVQTWSGINLANNTFLFEAPVGLPIKFASSVKVFIKHTGNSRKFLAGLASIVKD